MSSGRIALVRYPGEYFLQFGQALEQAGFEVFWISALRSDSLFLTSRGVDTSKILDTSAFNADGYSLEECRYRLSALEGPGQPTINDVILMDRILRHIDDDVAWKYLGHLEKVVTEFIRKNEITLVTSWRDTALQLLSMLICQRLGVAWIVPTRARIPQEMYGFCETHHTEPFMKFRDVTQQDSYWAASFLSEFRAKATPPAFKRAAKGWYDVFRMIPEHARAFRDEIRRTTADHGNVFSRYSLPDLIRMYVRRRFNMALYKTFSPCEEPGDERFCLFALHTQPESSIDVLGSYYSDQIALVTTIARSLPATHRLYVKVHPTDVDGQSLVFYKKIASLPSVKLIDFHHQTRELVNKTDIVFTLSGTIGYEAALLNKPVITFARNFYNSLPNVHYCGEPTGLPSLIEDVLRTGAVVDDVAVRAFLADLRASCFEGEVSRAWNNEPLYPADLARLKDVYRIVHSFLGHEPRYRLRLVGEVV